MLFAGYYSGDTVEKNQMGGARGTYGVEKSCIGGFGMDV